MSGTPVESFYGAALPVEEGEAGQRDDERDEKERGPVEAEVARIRSVARRGADVHATEGRERRKERVLGRGKAMIAERHEERHERRGPHASGKVFESDRVNHDRVA